MTIVDKLIFGRANKKLIKLEKKTGKKLFTFSLLSGVSCPGANECKAHIVETPSGRKLIDGPNAIFRCFSASQEALFTNVYESRKKNFELVKACGNSTDKLVKLIQNSLPTQAEIIRVHVAGDHLTYNYFLAWCKVAQLNPDKLFYSYTKSVNFYVKAKEKGVVPKNFNITASRGGRFDHLIDQHKLKQAIVVESKSVGDKLGFGKLEVDDDDSHAALGKKSFFLQLHSQGAKGSRQSEIFAIKHKKVKK